MTIWDLLQTDDDLCNCMKHPMIEGGKIRIYALYQHEPDSRKRAKFLRDEYKMSGRSYRLNSGRNGFVDYRASGIRIYSFDRQEDNIFRWHEAEERIAKMIGEERYMSDNDMHEWEQLNNRPYPSPRYKYP